MDQAQTESERLEMELPLEVGHDGAPDQKLAELDEGIIGLGKQDLEGLDTRLRDF